MIYLRYGCEDPLKKPRPPALLTAPQLAKILKLSKDRVEYLISCYFQEPKENRRGTIVPRYNPGDRAFTEATLKNITEDEATWIVSQDN